MQMTKNRRMGLMAAAMALAMPAAAQAEVPVGRPFAMRGVELGITLDAFRQIVAPTDGDRYFDVQTWCSNDPEKGRKLATPREDTFDGIVDCQWYSRTRDLPKLDHWEHWIDIGAGRGIPKFRFMPIAGELRLFRISFYANISYYDGILDALSRGYGAPRSKVEPFQTNAGGVYTSATSIWYNQLSSITLVQRCGHLERYCLEYDHTAFAKQYGALTEKRAAAAAGKI